MANRDGRQAPSEKTRFVALLRGVNVGGRNSVPMRELRTALEVEFTDVSTLLQSGNVLLASTLPEREVAETVTRVVQETFGLLIPAIVRTAAELAKVTDHNPFLEEGSARDPRTLHVAFLSTRPARVAIDAVDPARSPPDAFVMSGREIYLEYPGGSGRTRLTVDYLERCLGVTGTARNWRTVHRLASLCAA